MKKATFKPINKSIIHKDKITDKQVIIISTAEKSAKYMLVPNSSYTHGMNGSCKTIRFVGKRITQERLDPYDIDGEKVLKDWIKYCEDKKYDMYVFETLKEALTEFENIK